LFSRLTPTFLSSLIHLYHLLVDVHFFVEELVVELGVLDDVVDVDEVNELGVMLELGMVPSSA